jgi:hypothetical protein
MQIEHEISLFYGRAVIEPGEIAGSCSSWNICDLQNINTTIFYRNFSEDGSFEIIEIGSMVLYKLNHQVDVFDALDALDGDSSEVGEAMIMKKIKTRPYVLSWFEIKEQFRKQGLGHLALHVGLQSSGCEGHPLFLMPSPNENHAGFEFLTDFYLDSDMKTEMIDDTRIVFCPMYNNRNSVVIKRKKLKKQCL